MIFSVILLHWWGNRESTEELFQWSDVCSTLTDENWVDCWKWGDPWDGIWWHILLFWKWETDSRLADSSSLSNVGFLSSSEITDSLRVGWNWPEMRERLAILVIVGKRTNEHSLRSQVGIESESHCLFGQDLVDFGFWGRGEDWEIRGSGRRRGCKNITGIFCTYQRCKS